MELNQRILADGLAFPEGPVAMADGSVILVEIGGPCLTRVDADRQSSTIARWADRATAGPNGAAIGPDGAMYICNNGGFAWTNFRGREVPVDVPTGVNQPPEYVTGSIDRVDLATGEIQTIYTECDGERLHSPNDIVFDREGGFWFTDLGKARRWDHDNGAVLYARPDGSFIDRVIEDIELPNGCGLSPDDQTLYVACTPTGRLWAYELEAPGRTRHRLGRCIANTLGRLDSLAVEADGTIVVGALGDGVLVVRPDESHEFIAIDGRMITNVAFGGPDRRTAYLTDSGEGRLLAVDWPRPGLELAF